MPANNDFKVKQGLRIGTEITSYNNTAITNGQLLIGNTTSGSFDAATLTQGANLTITNAGGAITIAANASITNSAGRLVVRGLDGSFTANVITATLYGSANTVTTNAQPNITSVGTLTSLSVSGNTAVSSQLLITDTNTLAGSRYSFSVAGPTGTLSVIPNISAGSFNTLQSTGDIALVAQGATNGNVGLSIIPWAAAASGIRIGTVSNVTTITLGATTVNVTGNVGIGTSSPAVKLDVAGGGEIRSTDGTVQTFIQSSSGNGGYIGTRSNNFLSFRTNNTDRMRIDTSGNVGIGVTSPPSKLFVEASTSNTAYALITRTPVVGLTAGDYVNMAYFADARSTNNDGLRIVNIRDTTSSGAGEWFNSSYRIRRSVDWNDAATGVQEEIVFGSDLLAFNTGGTERLRIVNGGLTVTGNILSNLANGVATIGNSTNYFGNVFGTAMLARYADLAENYAADLHYEPGTVVEFGGANEITLATNETPRVAGIISTKPAYLMNMEQQGDNMLAVALQGRVPCKVTGVVHKGDMMVSAGNGYAKACTTPAMGTVIGKALENYFSSVEGVIEVVVGRL